ncbi:3'-5' exonuclease [Undibacterium fentianense]|uniref:3'-5' exonuclease domain-containing protein 2 n=1 Tax=Undibacterium fentianense TaxID=2828728 RepID=A0A941DZI1_9BURK|nr:3'-5' exonuclease [Undibacterium fentianense]MBR7799675.1 3'-5' exonuclease domain-containing protein 2 [Undibacterium fentianense]
MALLSSDSDNAVPSGPIDLPAYPGIALKQIKLIQTLEDAIEARQELSRETVLGYDTESKPIFSRGQINDGPHLVQLATSTHAYLFPIVSLLQQQNAKDCLKQVLESQDILKVGFGLSDDNQMLMRKLGIRIAKVIDLSRSLSESKKRQMGAKRAVEKYFGQILQKSKRVSTSNWAAEHLNERQLKYAADDAQSALLVYLASQR